MQFHPDWRYLSRLGISFFRIKNFQKVSKNIKEYQSVSKRFLVLVFISSLSLIYAWESPHVQISNLFNHYCKYKIRQGLFGWQRVTQLYILILSTKNWEKKVNSSLTKTNQKQKTLIGFHYRCLPPKVNTADIPHATLKSQNISWMRQSFQIAPPEIPNASLPPNWQIQWIPVSNTPN